MWRISEKAMQLNRTFYANLSIKNCKNDVAKLVISMQFVNQK
jgi:hypothetical protein